MAHFRGIVSPNNGRTETSRLGTARSGLTVEAQSWEGKVVVRLTHDPVAKRDDVEVTLRPHHGRGIDRLLYIGPVCGVLHAEKE